MKEIKFGEELSFNYESFTESETEYAAAACLCGTGLCSGRFLNMFSTKKQEVVQKKYHDFVDRNVILFRAIELAKSEGITDEDETRLNKFGLRNSVL